MKQFVQFFASLYTVNKDDNLIEVEGVQQIVEFSVLLLFCEFGVVLLKTVEGQFGFIVDVDFDRVLCEFAADRSDFLAQSGGKHHDLLLVGCGTEDGLDVLSHADRFEHLVALVENEAFQVTQVEVFFVNELQQTTGGADDNMRGFFLQQVGVVFEVDTTKEDLHFDVIEVFAVTQFTKFSFVTIGRKEGKESLKK